MGSRGDEHRHPVPRLVERCLVKFLIINADGYGFTEGISRAIEECIEFGTVRSLSANVNCSGSEGLRKLVAKHPYLSVGCHLNPVVGRPLLPPGEMASLVDGDGFSCTGGSLRVSRKDWCA